MAPGTSACKEVVDSHPSVSGHDIAVSKSESNSNSNSNSNSASTKVLLGLGGKLGVYSTNGVQELLECPVCTNLMYPPIYQVCALFPVFSILLYSHSNSGMSVEKKYF